MLLWFDLNVFFKAYLIQYIELVWCGKLGYNDLTNNKIQPIVCIVCMTGSFRLTYKLYQVILKTERLVCVTTDRPTDIRTNGHKDIHTHAETDRASPLPRLMMNEIIYSL